jgi:hypothetical protein
MIFRLLSIYLCLFFVPIVAIYAQEKFKTDLYLQISGSANAYKGDLNPSYQKWSGMFHLGVFSNQNRWVNPLASISLGSLTGQQTNYDYLQPQPRPNTFFKTNFFQFALGLRLNPIKTDNLTVFINPNIGIMRFTPRDIRNQKLAEQAETRALGEALPTTTFTIPVSIGAMYSFKASGVGIGAEVGLLNPRTDYLDNLGELGTAQNKDNSLQIKLSVYVPLTKLDVEEEKRKQEERKERRQEWLRKRGLLKDVNKEENKQKISTPEENKSTPAERQRLKEKERTAKEKQKKAENRTKQLEKNKAESEKKKQKLAKQKEKMQEGKKEAAEKRKEEADTKKRKANEQKLKTQEKRIKAAEKKKKENNKKKEKAAEQKKKAAEKKKKEAEKKKKKADEEKQKLQEKKKREAEKKAKAKI